jgi:4-hydroxybenzoate polyprenyltransferase
MHVGVFMGWSDLTTKSTIPIDILGPLYLGCFLWTITYETVYQHQVRLDMLPLC